MTQRYAFHRAGKLPLSLPKFLAMAAMLLFFTGGATAQNQQGISYSVELDTNIITIGDQINMAIKIKQPQGLKVEFPPFQDSLVSGVEILKQTGPDTIPAENGMVEVKKDLLITSFDGGVYKIPPMEFSIHYPNYMNILRTDTLALGVRTFEIDTTKANFDIMMPYDAPVSLMEVAPYGLGGLLLLALIAFAIYYIRKRKQNQPLFQKPEKPKEPAHVVALRKLDELKSTKLWQSGKVKEYHTQLTDALRIYLEERFRIATLEATSDEILSSTRNLNEFDRELQGKLEDILFRADLVKFAKLSPLPDENDRSLVNAYELVNQTIVQVVAEEEKTETKTSDEKEEEVNPKPLN
ncbi:MAG: hypothetical protein ACEPOZ_07035 [Marinifilaceae bacterium]